MKLLLAVFVFVTLNLGAQEHKLEKIWETDSVIATPESVLPVKDILYISLIDGAGWTMDGKGGVGKLTPDGKIIDTAWITGLSAPKGMGIVGNRLYVADMTEVIVIDMEKGKIEKKIKIDSAKGLNDITVTDKGVIYVSDTRGNRIWRLQNDMAELYLDSVTNVNGLKAIGDDLYIGWDKTLVKANSQKQISKIAEVLQQIDGIEPVGNGDFILTAWMGYIWYARADGRVETLLETHQLKKNTADIGYDQQKRIVYVPTFNGKSVVAYRLK
ncbi:MAG TPA: ATP-binding protein [Chitinophagaceae bacterium]|nr:ATP-binding protein [Chitinophagaceae bacterium]